MSKGERPGVFVSAARWAASIANSLGHFVALAVVRPFSRSAAEAVYRHWCRVGLRIFRITVSVRDDNAGGPGPGPRLYVHLNQSSLTEAAAYGIALPRIHAVINLEYAVMPVIGWGRTLLGDVVLVRQWKRQAKRGIERAAARLARGERWMISIEGARSRDRNLLPYKKGPIVMALRAQATIIPFAVHGAHEIMPKGEWRLRPGNIEVHFLQAIPTRGLSYEDRDKVMERLRVVARRELEPGPAWGAQVKGERARQRELTDTPSRS